MLAEEGLLDLVRDAWGSEASERAHAHLEEGALQYLPIDSRAFALAVDGRLEPGGEVETNYGKAAVEVLLTCDALYCWVLLHRFLFCVCVRVRVSVVSVCLCLCLSYE